MRRRSQETRQKILTAAEKIFTKKGYNNSSITEIAKAAKVSPTTLYGYFESKKELFAALELEDRFESYNPLKDKKRQEILAEALLLFGKQGYAETTMEEIARRVKLTKTALYQYFDSKEEVFSNVLSESRVNTAASHLEDNEFGDDWEGLIEYFGRTYMEMGNEPERQAIFKTVVRESHRVPALGDLYYYKGKSLVAGKLAGFLEKYQATGVLKPDVDLKLASFMYLNSLWVYNVLFKYISGIEKEFEEDAALKMAKDMFISIIKA